MIQSGLHIQHAPPININSLIQEASALAEHCPKDCEIGLSKDGRLVRKTDNPSLTIVGKADTAESESTESFSLTQSRLAQTLNGRNIGAAPCLKDILNIAPPKDISTDTFSYNGQTLTADNNRKPYPTSLNPFFDKHRG